MFDCDVFEIGMFEDGLFDIGMLQDGMFEVGGLMAACLKLVCWNAGGGRRHRRKTVTSTVNTREIQRALILS